MSDVLFYIVIFLSNTIQGVTGFAGTILAMPFALRLVGYDTAVPVLNLLGVLAGIYVFVFNARHVNVKELLRIISVMAVTMCAGIFLKDYLLGYSRVMYIILGVIVLLTAVSGIVKTVRPQGADRKLPEAVLYLLLALSGLVHGMFVCGGPLLISYLTGRIKDKQSFRATISTVWIFMNGLLLGTQIYQGMWTPEVIKSGAISVPFLIAGMAAGSFLYKRMSQKVFLIITYVLLVIASITLFLK